MNLVMEIDGYYEQVLLSGEDCTLKELKQIYKQVKKQAAIYMDVSRLLVAQYGFTQLAYYESQVAFVVDTDTDRIYIRTY